MLGPRVGHDSHPKYLALPVPTCCYLKTLQTQQKPLWTQYKARPNTNGGICSRWVPLGIHVGHINFNLLVYFFLALGSRRECGFCWNMGLNLHSYHVHSSVQTCQQGIHSSIGCSSQGDRWHLQHRGNCCNHLLSHPKGKS